MEPTRVLVDVHTPLLREIVLATLAETQGVRVMGGGEARGARSLRPDEDSLDDPSVDVVVLDEPRARGFPPLVTLLDRLPHLTFVLLARDGSWMRCFQGDAAPSLLVDFSPSILRRVVRTAGGDLDPEGSS